MTLIFFVLFSFFQRKVIVIVVLLQSEQTPQIWETYCFMTCIFLWTQPSQPHLPAVKYLGYAIE